MNLTAADLRANATAEEKAVNSVIQRLWRINGVAPYRTDIGARLFVGDHRTGVDESVDLDYWLVVSETDWSAFSAPEGSPLEPAAAAGQGVPYAAALDVEVLAYVYARHDLDLRATLFDVRADVRRALLDDTVKLAGADVLTLSAVTLDRQDAGTEASVLQYQTQLLIPECRGVPQLS